MATRKEVYRVIEGEIDYARSKWEMICKTRGVQYRDNAAKPVGDWLIFIRGYYNEAVHIASHVGDETETLHVIRKLAGLCVSCMRANGAVFRGSDETFAVSYDVVELAIDGERDYQDKLGADRTDFSEKSVFAYLCMFDTYLRRAIDGWTNNPNNFCALDNIRKLAAICVHCMEDCGAPERPRGLAI